MGGIFVFGSIVLGEAIPRLGELQECSVWEVLVACFALASQPATSLNGIGVEFLF